MRIKIIFNNYKKLIKKFAKVLSYFIKHQQKWKKIGGWFFWNFYQVNIGFSQIFILYRGQTLDIFFIKIYK